MEKDTSLKIGTTALEAWAPGLGILFHSLKLDIWTLPAPTINFPPTQENAHLLSSGVHCT